MSKLLKGIFSITALIATSFLTADDGGNFNAFTGKVIGKKVRLRVNADLESQVVRELAKDDLLVVTGEKGDFYTVEPLTDMKAYIFRSFVLDNVVEGNRVNVRLAPDLEAPIISHLSTGTRIDGIICEHHTKWLEIAPPKDTRFFVAKEFIEFAGDPQLKATVDKRKLAVGQLMESATLLTQAEMCKPFEEIDRERVVASFNQIIENYKDFPKFVEKAQDELASFTESFLQRKIAYLEKKTAQLSKQTIQEEVVDLATEAEKNVNATDRMRAWEHVEESLFLAWSAMHHAKNMNDFYNEQKLNSRIVTGVLDTYGEPVKNKPGDFVIKEKDVPIAYVYSTHVNLHNLVGKRVNLSVSPRSNNSFAFPAYYVLDAE